LFEKHAISIREMKGMPVVRHDGEEELGRVADVLVHPTEGRVIALVMETSAGQRRAIAEPDWFLDDGVVMARPRAAAGGEIAPELLASGVLAAEHLVGMKVITDEGNCLGYITDRGKYVGHVYDVLLLDDEAHVAYHVWNAPVATGSFYMAGSVPFSYSRSKEQIEVPRHTTTELAAPSLDEAIARAEH
jgi:sporulation protein YlmC with PRC-barrel domain